MTRTAGAALRRTLAIGGAAVLTVGLTALPAQAYTSTKVATYGNSTAFSPDGRWLAFSTTAKLVAADTNGRRDVYLKDLSTGVLRLISDPPGAAVANGDSDPIDADLSKPFAALDVSIDGQYVVFVSKATNLVPGDANGKYDVFRWTRSTGAIELVSARAGLPGVSANGNSSFPSMSGDGRYVAFQSYATNLTGTLPLLRNPGVNDLQVLVRDMVTRTTKFASLSVLSTFPNGNSRTPDISADGRFVAFHSAASNVTLGDANGKPDIFRRSLVTGAVVLVSRTTVGAQAADGSFRPSISGNGRYVAFESDAALDAGHDANSDRDVYLRDLVGLSTRLISYDNAGNASVIGYPSVRASVSADGSRVSYCSCDQAFDWPITVMSRWGTGARTVVSSNTVSSTISGNGRRVANLGWATEEYTSPTRWTDLGSYSYTGLPSIVVVGGVASITDLKTGVAQVTVNGAPKRLSAAGTIPVLHGQVVKAWNGAGRWKTVVVP